MSDRLPSGQFPPGVSGNPGGKRRGPTLAKTLRLLLSNDEEAWQLVKQLDAEERSAFEKAKGGDATALVECEGKHETIKFAVNVLRRSKFDNAVMREVFDRVDGKLAAAYTLPDDDDNTRIIRPVLYVAPEDPETAERFFGSFYADRPELETGRQAETQPRERADPKECAPSAGPAAEAPPRERAEQFVRALDFAGNELELGSPVPTLPPCGTARKL